jgi:hypothetical protein
VHVASLAGILSLRFTTAPRPAPYGALPVPLQELAGGPPAGFELVEAEGDTLLTLTKQQGGEVVRVDVMVNDQVGGGLGLVWWWR